MRRGNWPFPPETEVTKTTAPATIDSSAVAAARRYVAAMQEGNCDDAIALTLWMRERLEQVNLEEPERVTEIRETLCRSLNDRRLEGNRLTEEGMEDQYVLPPGAEIAYIRSDAGRTDLERAAAARVWAKVTYPRRERAPLDLAGAPIRSLVVGINTTSDAYILKAAVVGNLEIDWESIDIDWGS